MFISLISRCFASFIIKRDFDKKTFVLEKIAVNKLTCTVDIACSKKLILRLTLSVHWLLTRKTRQVFEILERKYKLGKESMLYCVVGVHERQATDYASLKEGSPDTS